MIKNIITAYAIMAFPDKSNNCPARYNSEMHPAVIVINTCAILPTKENTAPSTLNFGGRCKMRPAKSPLLLGVKMLNASPVSTARPASHIDCL